MPTFRKWSVSSVPSFTYLGGIFKRPKGVKSSSLGFDRKRGFGWKAIELELKEDVIGAVDRVPSELDLEDGAPQDYELKIDVNEV